MNSGKRFGGLLWKEFIHTSVHLFVAITFLELLVTDTKENKKDLPIESDYQGSMEELFAFVENLENA